MTVLRRSPFNAHRVTRRAYHAAKPRKLTIGIRREDPERIWERRSPLVPEAIQQLVEEENIDVVFQHCERRIWNDTDPRIRKAGARIEPTLASAHITLGVKEPPLDELLVNPVPSPYHEGPRLLPRSHLMFSHTIKGQLYNMELLSRFLTSGGSGNPPARLIDFELLTNEDGKRTVGFGWYAGVSGALESLSALGHALLELGVASQFLYVPRPHTRRELEDVYRVLRSGPEVDLSRGTPKGVGPIVIGVTGSGNVSQGALDLLKCLTHSTVTADSLPSLVSDPNTPLDRIYIVQVRPEDYLVRQDGERYNRSHYYSNPSEYSSEFQTKVAPYLTMLVNGAGWAPSFPRLMTNEQLAIALEKAQQVGRGRFICVGDISCDVEGGLEFMLRASTLSEPFYKTRPASLPAHLPSITMMSVDILPTALPYEASKHFSDALYPYLRTLIRDYHANGTGQSYKLDDQERSRLDALSRATVAQDGVLSEPFQWLEGPLGVWRQSLANAKRESPQASPTVLPEKKKKVLVLGSGMVAGPCIDEICSWKDTQLLVASDALSEAQRLTASHSNATAVVLDVTDTKRVSDLVSEADVIISLLPVPFHPSIAELCIMHQKHMVTASYISPDMKALHKRAESSSVLLLNEIGLDPGIDHCSAISLFDDLRTQQKDIVSFTSFCGGLPAPEGAEGVPLKYKFSWSPKGVLSAALNGARFKLWDQVHEISGTELLKQRFPNLPISDVLKLEGLANRDSLPYGDTYDLGPLSNIRTLFRGTLRYEGFSQLMDFFKTAGLLATDVKVLPESWSSLIDACLHAQNAIHPGNAQDSSDLLGLVGADGAEFVDPMSQLGILPPTWTDSSSQLVAKGDLPPLPKQPTSPIDLFATLLAHKLRYQPGERDLVVLSHEVVAKTPSTGKESIYSSSLVAYGTPESSAMARTVGLPVALATRIVLDGKVKARGVWGPGVDRELWRGVLLGLERYGIGMKESVTTRGSTGGIVETSLANARGVLV